MTDIVDRLREHARVTPSRVSGVGLISEAADEIERLQTKAQKDAREMLAAVENAEAETARLQAALEIIATMKPPIPVDGEGHAPNWDQYVFTRTWAAFAAELQRIAHTALGEDNRD